MDRPEVQEGGFRVSVESLVRRALPRDMAGVLQKTALRSRRILVGGLLGVFLFFVLWYSNIWQLGVARDLVLDYGFAGPGRGGGLPEEVALAVVQLAKTKDIPQQSREEILITQKVLAARAPCNFLVFGLGYDSLMWKTLNYGGRTVFLEETASWVAEMQRRHPGLEAYHMNYSTQLKNNGELLQHSRAERGGACRPSQHIPSSRCRLAITNLPESVQDVQWDVMMIDAPRGYFAEAPGRMGAIFTMAVMAKQRTSTAGGNYTDIMLHDVDRVVEKTFAEEFLCAENRVDGVHRLWHFQLYPSTDHSFCPLAEKAQEQVREQANTKKKKKKKRRKDPAS